MIITLEDIWQIGKLGDYKLHFARWNGETQPLEVVRDKGEWQGWQEYPPDTKRLQPPIYFFLDAVLP